MDPTHRKSLEKACQTRGQRATCLIQMAVSLTCLAQRKGCTPRWVEARSQNMHRQAGTEYQAKPSGPRKHASPSQRQRGREDKACRGRKVTLHLPCLSNQAETEQVQLPSQLLLVPSISKVMKLFYSQGLPSAQRENLCMGPKGQVPGTSRRGRICQQDSLSRAFG